MGKCLRTVELYFFNFFVMVKRKYIYGKLKGREERKDMKFIFF